MNYRTGTLVVALLAILFILCDMLSMHAASANILQQIYSLVFGLTCTVIVAAVAIITLVATMGGKK